MKLIKARPRPEETIAILIVVAAIGVAGWFAHRGTHSFTDRGFVQEQLAKAEGGQVLFLPVKLPDGYEAPEFYAPLTNGSDSDAATAWFASFQPINYDVFDHQPPPVEMCVQRIDDPSRPCSGLSGSGPEPEADRDPYIEHRIGTTLVVINAMLDVPELDEWQHVEFTNNLNKVTWLH
ncbi:hypothetical protein [Actinopolymorpha rutila]|uniref:Uncharacterized protein n=1 Tax=Actinopolymorpha rutila TaxID=446787 RepID=A0A852Z9Q4_9ACTN|nr:hypothetical protein [Actinopolymorpha rutila]NYH88572.1 hypothetical protein [Actinopolymorpha rutila]